MKMTRKEIEKYVPFNEQEEKDREEMLKWMDTGLDLLTRKDGFAHWTSSAWVVNHEHTKVLMAYHNIYDSWSWLGGHCDGDTDFLHVAIKEVKEESGITNILPVTEDIFSLEILTVDGHIKRGEYVPSHLHLNVTYLLEADEKEDVRIKEDENSNVGWFTFNGAVKASSEPWFKEHIYSKLNEKLAVYLEKHQ